VLPLVFDDGSGIVGPGGVFWFSLMGASESGMTALAALCREIKRYLFSKKIK